MKDRPSPIIALWLLITLAMAIFIGLSLSEDIKIGNHSLTKARFHETLFANKESDSPEEVPAEIQDTVPLPVEIKIEPDTTVHSVLVFGDSMSHHLAMSIAKYGKKNNYKVTGVSWESSSIPGWSGSGKIQEYINMTNPDFVIISLGSNEMELKNFEQRIPFVKDLVSQLDTIPYVWVGPPLWKKDKGVYAMLEKALPNGVLFKTENIDLERGPDHVHPTKRGADTWADTLMNWISKSQHPILTEKPDSGTTIKGNRFIYLHPKD